MNHSKPHLTHQPQLEIKNYCGSSLLLEHRHLQDPVVSAARCAPGSFTAVLVPEQAQGSSAWSMTTGKMKPWLVAGG